MELKLNQARNAQTQVQTSFNIKIEYEFPA